MQYSSDSFAQYLQSCVLSVLAVCISCMQIPSVRRVKFFGFDLNEMWHPSIRRVIGLLQLWFYFHRFGHHFGNNNIEHMYYCWDLGMLACIAKKKSVDQETVINNLSILLSMFFFLQHFFLSDSHNTYPVVFRRRYRNVT